MRSSRCRWCIQFFRSRVASLFRFSSVATGSFESCFFFLEKVASLCFPNQSLEVGERDSRDLNRRTKSRRCAACSRILKNFTLCAKMIRLNEEKDSLLVDRERKLLRLLNITKSRPLQIFNREKSILLEIDTLNSLTVKIYTTLFVQKCRNRVWNHLLLPEKQVTVNGLYPTLSARVAKECHCLSPSVIPEMQRHTPPVEEQRAEVWHNIDRSSYIISTDPGRVNGEYRVARSRSTVSSRADGTYANVARV